MSTYYFIVCDKHKERTDAASHTMAGIGCRLGDSDTTLNPFIVAHAGCPVRIVSEHEDDSYDESFADWTEENVREMALKDRD